MVAVIAGTGGATIPLVLAGAAVAGVGVTEMIIKDFDKIVL